MNFHLKFIHKEIATLDYKHKTIVICLKDIENDLIFPHPITSFITHNQSNLLNSINSQRTVAGYICRFLNFIYENITKNPSDFINIKGLQDLTLDHGMEYLKNLQRKQVSKNYYHSNKYYLNNFYNYLNDNNLLHEKTQNQLSYNMQYNSNKNIFDRNSLKSIRNINKNKKMKINDFGDNRYKLIKMFINTSRQVAPDITFGICLQIFGGLRKGEVINIMNDNIIYNDKELSIKISDNRDLLFPYKSDTKDESPKRVNYLEGNLLIQKILPIPLVNTLYEEHMQYLEEHVVTTKDAIFINKKGMAMTGQTYENRFLKVKKLFLERLLENRMYDDYYFLKNTMWSTHIGRGIYSNILFDMDLSVTQIAILRGDKSITSFQSYFDEMSSHKAVKENLPKLLEYLKSI